MPILNYGTKVKGDKFTAIMFNTIQNAINWIYDQLIAMGNTVGNLLSDNIVNGDSASAVGYTANRINNITSGLSSRIDSVSLSASESSAKVDEFETRVPTAAEKELWNSLADGMDIVLQVETSVSISPNVLNRWLSPVSSLTIDFSAGTIGKVNEYILEFKPASSSFTISLPSGVLWPEDPEWELGLTYQISVVNGLALYIAWDEEGNASGSGLPDGGGSSGGGGGGDINIIEGIKVNGRLIPPDSKKIVDITIPVADSVLDSTSENPIQNAAVAQALDGVNQSVSQLSESTAHVYESHSVKDVAWEQGTAYMNGNISRITSQSVGLYRASLSDFESAVVTNLSGGEVLFYVTRQGDESASSYPCLYAGSSSNSTFHVMGMQYPLWVWFSTDAVSVEGTLREIDPFVKISALDERLSNKADKVAVVNHGTSQTTLAIEPNVFHTWGSVSALTLTLAQPEDETMVNEYMFDFYSWNTATVLTLPEDVVWATDHTTATHMHYQVSILNNIAVMAGAPYEPI